MIGCPIQKSTVTTKKSHKYPYSSILGGSGLGRSSRPVVFYKKGVFKNFAKFTGKHLARVSNKVAGLRPAIF